MREVVPGENRLARFDLPLNALRAMRVLDGSIARRTQIVWGEHCSECAYPACYASCSHYTPRPDLHCRRFDRGIEAVEARDLEAPLMRVRFRKWGKLQGEGPAPLRPRYVTGLHERARALAGTVVDLAELPYGLRHGAGRAWTRAEALLGRRGDPSRASAFVVECVSLSERQVPFTLSIVPKDRFEAGLFQERIALGGSYTRHVISVDRIRSQINLSRPFLVQLEPLIESPEEAFLFGIVDFVTWAEEPAQAVVAAPAAPRTPAKKAKCIVWDLDDTLWEGILAEVGVGGIKLRPHVIEVLHALDARGILHSIASKNNEAEALAALKHFGIDELFLYPQVGWGPKSESVTRIAKRLDIGIDAFAFVDDQAFERSEVEETLGCVTVFAPTDLPALTAHNLFDVPMTPESSKRRLMYREEMRRTVAFEATGTSDYDAFLRSCRIRLQLSVLSDEDVTRIYDLSQRTNQVNVTGTRYERRAVEEMVLARGPTLPIVMRCEDRFGDYGTVGFVLLDPEGALVLDYFMSCRVQRKYVENALFAHLLAVVGARGATNLRCRYKRTERNKFALDLLAELGFQLSETAPGVGFLERDLTPIRGADVVTISAEGVR